MHYPSKLKKIGCFTLGIIYW